MRAVLAGAIAFITLGCYGGGGGGGERDPYDDLTCEQVSTDPYLFEIGDYKSQRISASDTLSAYQWHLKNWGQKSGAGVSGYHSTQIIANSDLRVESAWNMGLSGQNVVIAIVDSGADVTHPDLSPNYAANLSWNYVTNSQDPYPVFTSRNCAHGTAVAAIAAAKGGNDGVIGVAPNAKIAALNAIPCGKPPSSNAIADALSTSITETRGDDLPIDIFSNSWGCGEYIGSCSLHTEEMEAIYEGVSEARGGKGAIYLFAAGNDRERKIRSDYSRYLSAFEILPIAALDAQDLAADYSNPGANLLVSAYGGYGDKKPGIVTADIVGCKNGFNAVSSMRHWRNNFGGFTTLMNGTSAATPMASGVAALMLEKNPNLTWRDVRYILATTARKNDPSNSDWTTNGAGWHVNHNYGFGAIDAFAAVNKAAGFTTLSAFKEINASSALNGATAVVPSWISKIEHVNIDVELANEYSDTCEFNLTLISPSATQARFVDSEIASDVAWNLKSHFLHGGYNFGSPRFLDENATGIWTLELKSAESCSPKPNLKLWKISIKGRD
jgi:kexin